MDEMCQDVAIDIRRQLLRSKSFEKSQTQKKREIAYTLKRMVYWDTVPHDVFSM